MDANCSFLVAAVAVQSHVVLSFGKARRCVVGA